MARSRSRSPVFFRGGSHRRRGVEGRSGGPRGSPSHGGFAFMRGPPWDERARNSLPFHPEAPDDAKHLLDGPMLTFKQFVLRNPDGTSQDVLNEGYKSYLEKYRSHHASRFFDENHHLGFMQEAYNPNLLREQFLRCRERAQQEGRNFLQRWEEGGFRNLRLEAPVGLLANEGDVSPLLLEDWPRQVRVSTQPPGSSVSFGVVEIPTDFLLLPTSSCLEVHRVDPQINKFEILKALEKRGALYVAMVSSAGLTAPRTAHVFFASQQAADEALAQGPEFTLLRLCQERGGDIEALREFRLKLQRPPDVGASVHAFVTPPIAATTQRLRRDSERAWELIRTLDGQLDLCATDASHPLEEILDGVEDPWLRLDLMLTYLRRVHCVCYYSGKVYDDPQQLHLNAAAGHLRPAVPEGLLHFLEEHQQQEGNVDNSSSSSSSSGVSQQQQQWAQQLDERLEALLQMASRMQQNLPPPLDEQESPVIQSKWTAFCQEHTSKDSEGRFRCTLCQKLFKAPSFVHLHHRKKHERELARIINRYVPHLMRTAYINDPNKHISLPQQRDRQRNVQTKRPAPPPPGILPPGIPPARHFVPPPARLLLPGFRRQRDWDCPAGPAAPPLTVARPTASYDDL